MVVDTRDDVPEENEDNNTYLFRDAAFDIEDNFVLSFNAPGGGEDDFGKLVTTNTATMEFGATVITGSSPNRLTPAV